MKPKIYLAGPDVFLPDAAALAAAKKDVLTGLGMEGLFPLDNEIDSRFASDPALVAREIARQNFAMMDRADGCIAHLTPFRGPSADAGTIGEVFHMHALGKPVFGYSNDARTYKDRVTQDGMMVEDFGLFDNLMIPPVLAGLYVQQALANVYYTDLSAFTMAAEAAARYFSAQ